MDDFEQMTDLGQDLRARLADAFDTRALEIDSVRTSFDRTCKAVLRARDGSLVESVLIPEAERTTLCISTQLGCPLACTFCATGAMGFSRNLTTGEIIDQVCQMRRLLPPQRRITNVVFMGMGEPLLNLPAVAGAARILLHPKAFAMAPRRVTVSTVGIPGRIERLLPDGLDFHVPVDAGNPDAVVGLAYADGAGDMRAVPAVRQAPGCRDSIRRPQPHPLGRWGRRPGRRRHCRWRHR